MRIRVLAAITFALLISIALTTVKAAPTTAKSPIAISCAYDLPPPVVTIPQYDGALIRAAYPVTSNYDSTMPDDQLYDQKLLPGHRLPVQPPRRE